MKYCKYCKKSLPDEKFYKNSRRVDGLSTFCKDCYKNGTYYKTNKKKWREYAREYDSIIRLEVLNHYSRGALSCELCGYDNSLALTIDHINGGGLKQKKDLKLMGGAVFFRWLMKNDYPEGYRVLCRNCNWLERMKNLNKKYEKEELEKLL